MTQTGSVKYFQESMRDATTLLLKQEQKTEITQRDVVQRGTVDMTKQDAEVLIKVDPRIKDL